MSEELKRILAEVDKRFREFDQSMTYLMQALSVFYEQIVRMEKWIQDQKRRSLN